MHRQPHILIVDDDGFIRDAVNQIAKTLGYKSTLAKNGNEALQYAKEEIFDLIISDLYMPIMDGNELIIHIRSMPEYKNIPFIFLSGSDERKTWIKNLNAGADDFISKPFDKKILALKLRSHIKRYFLRKDLLKSNLEYNINLNEGILVYCTLPNIGFEINTQKIYAKTKVVYSNSELLETIEKNNLWLLLIDSNAVNEYDINKIKLSSNLNFSILFFAKNTREINAQLNQGIGNFILKSLPEKLLYHQINAFIAREMEVKSKYINAIKLAANNSPIRFERLTKQDFDTSHISVLHEPYKHIPGGDFYEIFTNPERELKIVVVGDVMGKKWGAWFIANAYVAYIRSTIHFLINNTPNQHINASSIVEHLNKQIAHDLQVAEVFTTLSVIVIRKNSEINIATAGAMRPLFLSYKDKSITQLNITGMMLGISEQSQYHQLDLKLNLYDKILFYSDGYTEIMNSKTNEMLSENAIIDVFTQLKNKQTIELEDIENTMIENYNVASFDDDRTLLLLSRLS